MNPWNILPPKGSFNDKKWDGRTKQAIWFQLRLQTRNDASPQGRVLNASLIVAKKALAGDSWGQDVLRLEGIKQPITRTNKLYYQKLNLPLLLFMHSHISLRKYLEDLILPLYLRIRPSQPLSYMLGFTLN